MIERMEEVFQLVNESNDQFWSQRLRLDGFHGFLSVKFEKNPWSFEKIRETNPGKNVKNPWKVLKNPWSFEDFFYQYLFTWLTNIKVLGISNGRGPTMVQIKTIQYHKTQAQWMLMKLKTEWAQFFNCPNLQFLTARNFLTVYVCINYYVKVVWMSLSVWYQMIQIKSKF